MAEAVHKAVEETDHAATPTYLDGLLPALGRLDGLLELAVSRAEAAYGPEAAADRYRGLHVSPEEVARLLTREPGAPTLWADGDEPLPEATGDGTSRLAWLRRAFGLSDFELDLMLLALAPELDRRYERLYAYLQDHVARRRPSVDLALNLLCADAAARLECRTSFDPGAPLFRHRLLHLVPEPNHDPPSLLAHTLKLDDQITRFLLHQDGLDRRLVPFCRLIYSNEFLEELPLEPETLDSLPHLIDRAWVERRPLRLYFHGPAGVGKRRAAAALTAELGLPLLTVNLTQLLAANLDVAGTMRLIFRYAWFYDAIPYLDGLEAVCPDRQPALCEQLLDILADDAGITILAGRQPWVPTGRQALGVVFVPFTLPGVVERRICWQTETTAAGLTIDKQTLDALAGRFRLTPPQIADAVATAANQQIHQPAVAEQLPSNHAAIASLFTAARAQSGHDLATLAQKIEPLYTWDDIILPEDSLAQLREICQRVAHRHRVLETWGFDQKLSQGKGTNALFAGPSGTGKTMAAEIIATELGLDLYKIDLAGVVSKYIGETEKNLDRIFRAAENANAILFFDEADALFGKRSEVRDSHDRYANIEISYLLQKMEAYDGLAILATNLRRNLDEAFLRRLAFTVHFPFPDAASRLLIWEGIWPGQTPLASDLALDALAKQFRLSGGNIKNAALAAAFIAAEDGRIVRMEHLLHAVRREYQKLGRTLSETELDVARGNGQLEVQA